MNTINYQDEDIKTQIEKHMFIVRIVWGVLNSIVVIYGIGLFLKTIYERKEQPEIEKKRNDSVKKEIEDAENIYNKNEPFIQNKKESHYDNDQENQD